MGNKVLYMSKDVQISVSKCTEGVRKMREGWGRGGRERGEGGGDRDRTERNIFVVVDKMTKHHHTLYHTRFYTRVTETDWVFNITSEHLNKIIFQKKTVTVTNN